MSACGSQGLRTPHLPETSVNCFPGQTDECNEQEGWPGWQAQDEHEPRAGQQHSGHITLQASPEH